MVSREIQLLAKKIAEQRNWPTALATAVSGAFAYVVAIGGQQTILSPGVGLMELGDDLVSAFTSGASRWLSTASAQWGRAWSTSLDLGLVQLPYNLLAVLLTFGVIAYLLDRWRGD